MSENPTITAFGYPETLVREYEHWVVLVRRSQVTLGSLIVAARSDSTCLGSIGSGAWADFAEVSRALEAVLAAAFTYDRINYLALMMRDPNVHFHVIPRYASPRDFAEIRFEDACWPKPPDLARGVQLGTDEIRALVDHLRAHWI